MNISVLKLSLIVMIGLLFSAVITHTVDDLYYHNTLSKQAEFYYKQESSTESDFTYLADITIFQYANINPSCSQFKDGADKVQCQNTEQSKYALQKSKLTYGQLLSSR